MPSPIARGRQFLSRWIRREEEALRRLFHGKSADVRLEGMRRSERNEAKIFLLAMTPVVVVGPFVGKWSSASTFGKIMLALLAAWLLAVLLLGGFLMFRSIVRAADRHANRD